jgi:hypothetical protein
VQGWQRSTLSVRACVRPGSSKRVPLLESSFSHAAAGPPDMIRAARLQEAAIDTPDGGWPWLEASLPGDGLFVPKHLGLEL